MILVRTQIAKRQDGNRFLIRALRLGDVYLRVGFSIRCAHYPVSGKVEKPGEDQRDREAEHDEKHNETNRPIRNIKYWKNLRDTLSQSPTADRVTDRHLVDLAPFELGKKFLRVHLFSDGRKSRREPGKSMRSFVER